jgi:catechol 2,3-dioxygenase
MTELGHIVFYVQDLEKSTAFYRDIAGLQQVGTLFGGRAAAFSGGRTHHELLLIEVGAAPGPMHGRRIGLYHVGWKIGESLEALRQAHKRITAAGYALDGISDHTVSQSLYLRDPDGNEIELFVDDPAIDWKTSTAWLNQPVKPLQL